MFPGAGKSLLARISIYVRLVFYLRETKDSPWPHFLAKKRLPRFLYVSLGNETVCNCADAFIKMVDELNDVYDSSVIRDLVVRKYAKSFTELSADPRLLEFSNKKVSPDGLVHFDINTV